MGAERCRQDSLTVSALAADRTCGEAFSKTGNRDGDCDDSRNVDRGVVVWGAWPPPVQVRKRWGRRGEALPAERTMDLERAQHF
jgi:hypothetical protein